MDRVSDGGGEPFLLGVNYWPRAKAMYWWADFDPGEVREEFAMIRALGLGHVRIFLLWESFQPRPDVVDASALRDLRTVADIAAETGLKIEPTFFTGHMSGPNWAPDWLLDESHPSVPAIARSSASDVRRRRATTSTTRTSSHSSSTRSGSSCGPSAPPCAITPPSGPGASATSPTCSRGRRTPMPDGPGWRRWSPPSGTWIPITPCSSACTALGACRRRAADRSCRRGDRHLGHARLFDLRLAGARAARPRPRPVYRGADGRARQATNPLRGVRREHAAPGWRRATGRSCRCGTAARVGRISPPKRPAPSTTRQCWSGCTGSGASARSPGASVTMSTPSGTGRRAISRSTSASSASIARTDRSNRWARPCATSRHQRRR